jgi:hypothetical protein
LALFVQKRYAWIHISEWGILYLITKIGFFLVKTQNRANFLVFEGFLGEKILTNITHLREIDQKHENESTLAWSIFFIWHPGKSVKAQHPRVAALLWGR